MGQCGIIYPDGILYRIKQGKFCWNIIRNFIWKIFCWMGNKKSKGRFEWKIYLEDSVYYTENKYMYNIRIIYGKYTLI